MEASNPEAGWCFITFIKLSDVLAIKEKDGQDLSMARSHLAVSRDRVMPSGKQPHRGLWHLEGAVPGNPFTRDTPKISMKS